MQRDGEATKGPSAARMQRDWEASREPKTDRAFGVDPAVALLVDDRQSPVLVLHRSNEIDHAVHLGFYWDRSHFVNELGSSEARFGMEDCRRLLSRGRKNLWSVSRVCRASLISFTR